MENNERSVSRERLPSLSMEVYHPNRACLAGETLERATRKRPFLEGSGYSYSSGLIPGSWFGLSSPVWSPGTDGQASKAWDCDELEGKWGEP